MIITTSFLKKYHACSEGIEFFKRNFSETLFPNGLDLSKIKVDGDFNNYFVWINDLLRCSIYPKKHNISLDDELTYDFEYNSYGDIVKKIYSDGSIAEWKYEYDSNGNILKRELPNGTIYEYDSKGKIIKEILQFGSIYQSIYNKNDILIEKILPDGEIWKFNQYGDIVKKIYSDGSIAEWKHEYDVNKNLIKKILPNGTIYEWKYQYDSIGRLIQVDKCYIEYLY